MAQDALTLEKLEECLKFLDDKRDELHNAFNLYKPRIPTIPIAPDFRFGSVGFKTSEYLVDTQEDWSGCRSLPRAKRRRRMGHRQRVKTTTTPKAEAYTIDGGRTFILHPTIMKEVEKAVAKMQQSMDDQILKTLLGGS